MPYVRPWSVALDLDKFEGRRRPSWIIENAHLTKAIFVLPGPSLHGAWGSSTHESSFPRRPLQLARVCPTSELATLSVQDKVNVVSADAILLHEAVDRRFPLFAFVLLEFIRKWREIVPKIPGLWQNIAP